MRKKLITVITTVCMVVGLLIPMITSNETEVHAQTTPTKNIMLGVSGLKGGQASNVYMGKYPQSKMTDITDKTEHVDYETLTYDGGPHYFAIEPMKWRVLDSEKGLLVSDMIIDSRRFDDNSGDWDSSEIKAWLNNNTPLTHNNSGATGFKGYAFSVNEKTALEAGNIFLLSKGEAEDGKYFSNDVARQALRSEYEIGRVRTRNSNPSGSFFDWWLSSLGHGAISAANVSDGGAVDSFGYLVLIDYGVRPALNLNLNSVLFTSATVGGKSTSTVGAGEMSQILEYTGTDWKVTVKDTARNTFTASTTSSTTILPTGGKVNVEWDNAKTGNDEYISYMITDSGNTEALYYGSIPSASVKGSQAITIPANLTAGSYNLRVLNEQKNDDKYTDYASEFKDIAFTVPAKPTITSLSTNTTPAALDGTIEMTFSEEMDATKGSVKLGAETLSGTWSSDKKTYTVSYAGLLNSTEYTVNVSGFESELGGVMDARTHTFTTLAKTPVLMSSASQQEFGEVTKNSNSLKTIEISSDGLTGPIAYEVVGIDKSNFTVTKDNRYSSASGGKLNITFIPTKEGKHTATLKLTSIGATPITIDLTGEGMAKAQDNTPVAPTPITPTPPAQGDTSTPTSPKTGDSNKTTLFLGLLVLSGIIVVEMKRRKALNK